MAAVVATDDVVGGSVIKDTTFCVNVEMDSVAA